MLLGVFLFKAVTAVRIKNIIILSSQCSIILLISFVLFYKGEQLTVLDKQTDHWWIAKNSRGFVMFVKNNALENNSIVWASH